MVEISTKIYEGKLCRTSNRSLQKNFPHLHSEKLLVISAGDLRLSYSTHLYKLSTLNQIFTKIARPLCNGLLSREKMHFSWRSDFQKCKISRISRASLALQLRKSETTGGYLTSVLFGHMWEVWVTSLHCHCSFFPVTEKEIETGDITNSTWIKGCGWPCWPPETTTSLMEHSQ